MQRADSFFLRELVAMGFPEVRAAKALLKTYNVGVEPAVTWIVEHSDDPDIDEPLREGHGGTSGGGVGGGGEGSSSDPVVGVPSHLPIIINPDDTQAAASFSEVGECKTVLVVASQPGMSAGKIGAQCAHAAVGLYRKLLQGRHPWMTAWEESGEKTVVLRGGGCQELFQMQETAALLQLPCFLVLDAGRTEVATVLAIGGVSEVVDRVTGHLPTL